MPAPASELELLTRAGCGLCDELRHELQAALEGGAARLVLRDVDADPELRRRFGWHVPVLRVDGEVLCAHRLDRERLAAALAGRPWAPLELAPTP